MSDVADHNNPFLFDDAKVNDVRLGGNRSDRIPNLPTLSFDYGAVRKNLQGIDRIKDPLQH